MVVLQYPDIASVFPNADATVNNSGNWLPGATEPAINFNCRTEPQTGGGVVKATDGSNINFSWIVYCPLDTPVIKIGSQIIIYGRFQVTDTVKLFYKGQLNIRIWL